MQLLRKEWQESSFNASKVENSRLIAEEELGEQTFEKSRLF